MNNHWDLEQYEETEEDYYVKILSDSLSRENKLDDNFDFEEVLTDDSVISEAILCSDNLLRLVPSHDGLRTLLAKDKEAGLERLVVQYGRLFHQIAYSVLYSYDLAQDAVSEAYIKIDKWLKDAKKSEILSINLLPYLCKIVLNASLDCLKSEKTQRLRKDRKQREFSIDQRRRFETADEVLEREEEKRIVHEEIGQLSAKYCRAIQLRYFLDEDILGSLSEIENERYAQLAAFADLNEATLRSHVRRGKILLKKRLHARGIDH